MVDTSCDDLSAHNPLGLIRKGEQSPLIFKSEPYRHLVDSDTILFSKLRQQSVRDPEFL